MEKNTMSTFIDDERLAALDQVWEFNVDQFAIGRFGQLVVERALEHVGSTAWTTEVESLAALEDRIIATQRTPSWRSAVVELEDVVGNGCIASSRCAADRSMRIWRDASRLTSWRPGGGSASSSRRCSRARSSASGSPSGRSRRRSAPEHAPDRRPDMG